MFHFRYCLKTSAQIFLAVLFSSVTIGQDESRLEAQFKKLDRNGDGKLTLAEAPRIKRWFRETDHDQSGDVSLEEVKQYFLKLRQSSTPDPSLPSETIIADDFPSIGIPISIDSCKAAAHYSNEKNGHALVVIHKGKTLFENYDNGWSSEKPHRLASGTKTFSTAILCVAQKEGLLELDEPVSRTIEEWQDHEQLAKITIRQLLSLTSGINGGSVGAVPNYKDAIVVDGVRRKPGESYSYGPVPFQIFGELLSRKLKRDSASKIRDPLAYLEQKIFQPIGLKYAQWRRADDGLPHLPSGAFVTAKEWAKFGEYLLRRTDNPTVFADCLKGSTAKPNYGLAIWLLDSPDQPNLSGAFMAAGAGKQRLYVVPKLNLVVVRFGESKKSYQDDELLKILLKTGHSK